MIMCVCVCCCSAYVCVCAAASRAYKRRITPIPLKTPNSKREETREQKESKVAFHIHCAELLQDLLMQHNYFSIDLKVVCFHP